MLQVQYKIVYFYYLILKLKIKNRQFVNIFFFLNVDGINIYLTIK